MLGCTAVKQKQLQIELFRLPSQGQSFCFQSHNHPVYEKLSHLIDSNPYQVQLQLAPIGKYSFEAKGSFDTHIDRPCARCGQSVHYPFKHNFYEVLQADEPAELSVDLDGPYCHFVPSGQLHLPEYLHELLASHEPYALYCRQSSPPAHCQTQTESIENWTPLQHELKKLRYLLK